jgi:hypothetical protein
MTSLPPNERNEKIKEFEQKLFDPDVRIHVGNLDVRNDI